MIDLSIKPVNAISSVTARGGEVLRKSDSVEKNQRLIEPAPENADAAALYLKPDSQEPVIKPPVSVQAEQLATGLTESMNFLSRDIEYSVDQDTNRLVIKVIDRHTGAVIRELPPEEMLELMKKMEDLQGVIFRGEV